MKKIIVFLFLFLTLNTTYAFDYLFTRYNSAESLGNGANNIAFANSLSKIIYNPAGLVYIAGPQTLFSLATINNKNFLFNIAYGQPISEYTPLSIAINGSYYFSSPITLYNFGTGIGMQFNIIKIGLYSSLFFSPDDTQSKHLKSKLGILLTPAFFNLGTTLQHIYENHESKFKWDIQLGFKIIPNLELSYGLHKDIITKTSFFQNFGFNYKFTDFLKLGSNYDFNEQKFSFGTYLSSYILSLNLATIYNFSLKTWDYAICFQYNF